MSIEALQATARRVHAPHVACVQHLGKAGRWVRRGCTGGLHLQCPNVPGHMLLDHDVASLPSRWGHQLYVPDEMAVLPEDLSLRVLAISTDFLGNTPELDVVQWMSSCAA